MHSRFAVALLVAVTLAAAACGGVTDPSKNKTETFTGTLTINGNAATTFTASNSGEYSITLSSLTPSVNVFVGLIFGQNSSSGCVPVQQNNFATIGVPLTGAIIPGSYCVVIYDVGALTQTEAFSVSISHP